VRSACYTSSLSLLTPHSFLLTFTTLGPQPLSPSVLASALIFVTAFGAFAGFWLVITGLLSSLSGWPTLAATFPAGARPDGKGLWGQVLGIGKVRENNVTCLIPSPSGLYLYAMALFRFRRPPVLVPWAKVRYVDAGKFLWSRWYVLDLGGVTTLSVRPRLLPFLRANGVAIPPDALAELRRG
jgi:hypothetical protein